MPTYPYALGAVEPSPGDAALCAALATPAEDYRRPLPDEINLGCYLGPQWCQGAGNTCVAHAFAGLFAWHERSQGREGLISRWHLYALTKANDDFPACGGTSLAAMARILSVRGAVAESVAPYPESDDPCVYARMPDLPEYTHRHHLPTRAIPRLSESTTGLEVRAIQAALVRHTPVVTSVKVMASAMTPRYIAAGLLCEVPGDQPIGGHAVLVYGYELDAHAPGGGYFLVRNSWHDWGKRGSHGMYVGRVSFQYVAAHGLEARALREDPQDVATMPPTWRRGAFADCCS